MSGEDCLKRALQFCTGFIPTLIGFSNASGGNDGDRSNAFFNLIFNTKGCR
ncbi:hypothetical protein PO124_12840 [Bacillus licheniformis]|nr:hypothetical protein [Bacillus licheniformis]